MLELLEVFCSRFLRLTLQDFAVFSSPWEREDGSSLVVLPAQRRTGLNWSNPWVELEGAVPSRPQNLRQPAAPWGDHNDAGCADPSNSLESDPLPREALAVDAPMVFSVLVGGRQVMRGEKIWGTVMFQGYRG